MSTRAVRKAHDLTAALQERPEGLTVTELATLLGVPSGRIRQWIAEDGLPAVRYAASTRARWPDVLAWYAQFLSPGTRRVGQTIVCTNCGTGRRARV